MLAFTQCYGVRLDRLTGGNQLKEKARKRFAFVIYCLGVASLSLSIIWSGNLCRAEDKQTAAEKYKPASETPESLKGKQIFQAHHCASCHSSGTGGGCLGPPLLGVGARRSREYITARITDDKEQIEKFKNLYCAQELMPHPRLPKTLATPLVAYLMTLPEPAQGFKVGKHAGQLAIKSEPTKKTLPHQTSVALGKKLFYEKGCTACHSMFGAGGQFAPALDQVSNRLTREQISNRITQAELLALGPSFEYQERGTVMPPCDLTPSEIKEITDFLLSLTGKK